MNKKYLYRGVSKSQYAKESKGLEPKKVGPFIYVFSCGEIIDSGNGRVFSCGDGILCGENIENAILRHQIDQKAGFPTSGISTTPHYARAKFYATHNYTTSGYVLIIDREVLIINGITEYIVSEYVAKPSVPEDDEIILVAKDGGILPISIILDEIFFSHTSSR